MNECQESQTNNISLIDLICYCLEKWRWIVASMLIAAAIAGGYKYQATVLENQSNQNVMISDEDMEKDDSLQSIEFYEHAIEEMEYDLEKQEDYLKRSVVMQLDPYHVSTGTLSYYIESSENLNGVIAAYSTFISSGRMAEELYSTTDLDIPVEDLRYLTSFTSSAGEEYRIDDNQFIRPSGTGGAVLQIQIRMPDDELGETYLSRVEELMREYTSQLQTEVGEHKLNLLASVQSEMSDLDIQEHQSTTRLAYTTSVRNLQSLRTEFETIHGTQGIEEEAMIVRNPITSAIKFAIYGLVIGVFLSCIVLLVVYFLGGKLQDTRCFKEEFGMPMLGMVRVSGQKRKLFGFIDNWVFSLRGGAYAKINFEEQIKMAAANVQTAISSILPDRACGKIMLSGTMAEKDVAVLCKQLTAELQDISWSSYCQIVFQASALRELSNYDGILFLEKRSSSDSEFIAQEKKLALDRNVKVLGTIVVC